MIIQANAMHIPLADKSVQCVVTSPPYWGLRDYGTAVWEGGDDGCDHKVSHQNDRLMLGSDGTPGRNCTSWTTRDATPTSGNCPKCGATRIDSQIGLEKSPSEYVEKIVAVFREVRRVLRDDGTVWCNLGDSYAGGFGSGGRTEFAALKRTEGMFFDGSGLSTGLKPKNLVGVPWRVAFALQADGWYLRSDIIWAKPNPMPESVTDRPTKAHEYIFLLTKSERYYYDQHAVREPHSLESHARGKNGSTKQTRAVGLPRYHRDDARDLEIMDNHPAGRNLRTVWNIATQPYPEAHFATFPEEIAKRCIMAGTSEKGACSECGAPWERVVERGSLVLGDGHSRPNNRAKIDEAGYSAYSSPNGLGKTNTPGAFFENKTLGWQPTCKCEDDLTLSVDQLAIQSCVVLDPFCGSGTVVQVAQDLGRVGIGIDIKPDYLKMAKLRAAQLGLRLEGGAVA